MNITTLNFPPIMPDNDMYYLRLLEAFLNSVDESCNAEVTYRLASIGIRIAPSTPDYTQHILETVKEMHYMIGLRVEFSKSIRTSSTIDYIIENV
jgi:hypothetical protein